MVYLSVDYFNSGRNLWNYWLDWHKNLFWKFMVTRVWSSIHHYQQGYIFGFVKKNILTMIGCIAAKLKIDNVSIGMWAGILIWLCVSCFDCKCCTNSTWFDLIPSQFLKKWRAHDLWENPPHQGWNVLEICIGSNLHSHTTTWQLCRPLSVTFLK